MIDFMMSPMAGIIAGLIVMIFGFTGLIVLFKEGEDHDNSK